MRMNMVLEILDVPGQLVSVLKPIGTLGANLVTIIHKRDIKNEKGMVPVQLTLEGERENLNAVIEKFKEMNISICEIDGVMRKEKFSTILIGHIIDTDVRDTVDKINAVEGISVVGLEVKLDGELESTAMLTIELDVGLMDLVLNKVKEIADEKNLIIINEV